MNHFYWLRNLSLLWLMHCMINSTRNNRKEKYFSWILEKQHMILLQKKIVIYSAFPFNGSILLPTEHFLCLTIDGWSQSATISQIEFHCKNFFSTIIYNYFVLQYLLFTQDIKTLYSFLHFPINHCMTKNIVSFT